MSMRRYTISCQMLGCLIFIITLFRGVISSIPEECKQIEFEKVVNEDHYNLTRASLTELSVNNASVLIKWSVDDTANVCGFTIFVWKVIDGSAKAHVENVTGDINVRTMLIENLKPGTLYEIYVETVYSTQHKTVSWKQQAKTLGFGPDNNVLNCAVHGTETWDQETGTCTCKQPMSYGNLCDLCLTGAYMHPEDGCSGCDDCDIRLGRNGTCRYDKEEGMMCNCMQGYTGKHCDSCIAGDYYREPITNVSIPCIKCDANTANNPSCYQQLPSPVSADTAVHRGAIIGVFATIMIICAVIVCYIYVRHWRSNKRTRGFVAARTKEHNDRIKFSTMMEDPDVDFYTSIPRK